jgi:hypothetical protein
VLENTYKHVAKLDYTNIQVHVLDGGGLEPSSTTSPAITSRT